MPRLPTPHGDAVMLLALLSSLVEARSMGSEVREAAVRVGKRRETCFGWPFVTVLQAMQRHVRTPAPWVHAGKRRVKNAAEDLCVRRRQEVYDRQCMRNRP